MANVVTIRLIYDSAGSGKKLSATRHGVVEIGKGAETAATGFRRLHQSGGTALSTIKQVALAIGAYKAFQLAARQMRAATAEASALQEVQSKFETVFSGQLGLATKWAGELVAGYAMSRVESRRYLSSVQDLLVPMGVLPQEAARLSNEIVRLSADIGSFNDMPTAKVMDDIQSALVGNYETMKKYGVVLNASSVEQKALTMGLADSKEEINASHKAMAAYQLIVEGSTAALGDMNRTYDSNANLQKRVQRSYANISATIGGLFLPAQADILNNIEIWLQKNEALIQQDLPTIMNGIGSAAGFAAEGFGFLFDTGESVWNLLSALPSGVIEFFLNVGDSSDIADKKIQDLGVTILHMPLPDPTPWQAFWNFLGAIGKGITEIFVASLSSVGNLFGMLVKTAWDTVVGIASSFDKLGNIIWSAMTLNAKGIKQGWTDLMAAGAGILNKSAKNYDAYSRAVTKSWDKANTEVVTSFKNMHGSQEVLFKEQRSARDAWARNEKRGIEAVERAERRLGLETKLLAKTQNDLTGVEKASTAGRSKLTKATKLNYDQVLNLNEAKKTGTDLWLADDRAIEKEKRSVFDLQREQKALLATMDKSGESVKKTTVSRRELTRAAKDNAAEIRELEKSVTATEKVEAEFKTTTEDLDWGVDQLTRSIQEQELALNKTAFAQNKAAEAQRQATADAIDLQNRMSESMDDTYDDFGKVTDAQYESAEATKKRVEEERRAADEEERIRREGLLDHGTFIDGLSLGWLDTLESQKTWAEEGKALFGTFKSGLDTALGDSIYNMFTGDFKGVTDAWKKFGSDLLKYIANLAGRILATEGIKLVAGAFGYDIDLSGAAGGGGGGGGGGAGGQIVKAGGSVVLKEGAKAAYSYVSEAAASYFGGGAATGAATGAAAGGSAGAGMAGGSVGGAGVSGVTGASGSSAAGAGMASGSVAGYAGVAGLALVVAQGFWSAHKMGKRNKEFRKKIDGFQNDMVAAIGEGDVELAAAYQGQMDNAMGAWKPHESAVSMRKRFEDNNKEIQQAIRDGADIDFTPMSKILTEKYGDSIDNVEWTFLKNVLQNEIDSTLKTGEDKGLIEMSVAIANVDSSTFEQRMQALGMIGSATGWESDATISMLTSLKKGDVAWNSIKKYLADAGLSDTETIKTIKAEYNGIKGLKDVPALAEAMDAVGEEVTIDKTIKAGYRAAGGMRDMPALQAGMDHTGRDAQALKRITAEFRGSGGMSSVFGLIEGMNLPGRDAQAVKKVVAGFDGVVGAGNIPALKQALEMAGVNASVRKTVIAGFQAAGGMSTSTALKAGMDMTGRDVEAVKQVIGEYTGNLSKAELEGYMRATGGSQRTIREIQANIDVDIPPVRADSGAFNNFKMVADKSSFNNFEMNANLGRATGGPLLYGNGGRIGDGWLARHPGGGMINEGSGLRDDVWLGNLGGRKHMAMAREYVVNQDATRVNLPFLVALNREKRPITDILAEHYHDGGHVGPAPMTFAALPTTSRSGRSGRPVNVSVPVAITVVTPDGKKLAKQAMKLTFDEFRRAGRAEKIVVDTRSVGDLR